MTPRERYILDHAPTMLLVLATRSDADAKLDLDKAIRSAGALYDRILAQAAAPPEGKAATPRVTADAYGALSDALREGFDRFYAAYGVKHGKQRAAARWAQIAPDAALVKRIALAAQADRAQPRAADAVRKWPEGWLSERRWEDVPLPGDAPETHADPQALRAAQVRDLVNERAGLKRLAGTGDPHIKALLADIDQRLAALGITPDAPRETLPPPGPRPLVAILARSGT